MEGAVGSGLGARREAGASRPLSANEGRARLRVFFIYYFLWGQYQEAAVGQFIDSQRRGSRGMEGSELHPVPAPGLVF